MVGPQIRSSVPAWPCALAQYPMLDLVVDQPSTLDHCGTQGRVILSTELLIGLDIWQQGSSNSELPWLWEPQQLTWPPLSHHWRTQAQVQASYTLFPVNKWLHGVQGHRL